jgi:hypothetical protein
MTTTLTVTSGQTSFTAQGWTILPSPGTAVPDGVAPAIISAAYVAGVVLSSSAGTGSVIVGARSFYSSGTGPPTSGSWLLGDEVEDSTGTVYRCTAAGSPGTWVQPGSGTYAPLLSPQFTDKVGFGATPTAQQPFASSQSLPASATGSRDKVAHEFVSSITGDLSASTGGGNPQFAWGLNVFTVTGTAANDGNGGTIQNLIETDVAAPSGAISVVQGLLVQAAFFGASAGATVGQMESLRVCAPARKDGATAGTANNVYGLFVEAVSAVGGGGSTFSVFVAGGVSRFGGRVDVNNTIANNGAGDLNIYSGFSNTDGGGITLNKAANGGYVTAYLNTANSWFFIHDGSNPTFAVSRSGQPRWWAAANAQTTVGAAGGASALPATPTKYFKVQDSGGTTYVIPAYAAS